MGLYDAMNNSPKEKKEKTLLKDIEGRPMEFGRSDALKYTPYVGTEKEVLAAAIARGDQYYIDPNNKDYPKQSTNRQNKAGWNNKMAEKRKAYEDDLYNTYKRGISKAPGNVIFGAEAPAVQSPTLPESVAYLDGTMPKKVAKSTTAQPTAAVPAATKEGAPAAKPETTEQTPAQQEQPVENGEYIELNGKRYKKVNFDEIPNNHAAARAAGYPIFRKPDGGITGALEGNEVDNIGKYYAQINGEWYEVVDNPIAKDAGRTFGIPQPTTTTVAQSTATTTQQEAAKDEVPAQPASTAQQTTEAPAATENAAGANPWKHTKNWWQPSTYVQDEEAYQKLILEQQRREERNEKRRRNRALIADLVNMGVALGSTAGGAVAVPEVPILSKKSNDKLRELREKQAALQLEFAKNMHKARQLDAQDFAKRVKAEVDAEKEATKDAETKEYRNKQIELAEKRLAIAKNKGKDNGSRNSKDTWTIEGKTYTDVFDAWVALPEDARAPGVDEEGRVKVPSTTQMKVDLAMYKKNKEAKKTTNKQQTNSNKKTNKQQTNSKKTTTSNSSPQQAKEESREPKKKEDKVGSSAMADLVKKAEEIMNNTPPSRR